MKKILVLLGLLIIVGCSPENKRIGKGKILRDAEDCAYFAKAGTGEVIFLTYSKELSGERCDFKIE